MKTVFESHAQPDDLTTLPAFIQKWHANYPLMGNPPNALFSIRDDLIIYLIGAIRDIPCTPPMCGPEEWDDFIKIIGSHLIIPFIASHILSWHKEFQPPEKTLSVFKNALFAGTARNIFMGDQIRQILLKFQEAGIPVLLVKGPALGRTIYPDLAMRQSTDIDLLIRPDDFLHCEKVMGTLGYSSTALTYHISRYAFHHQAFLPEKIGVMVEIHWMADFGFGYFPENWLDNSLKRKIHVQSKDLIFDTLHPEDHLQFLVFHNVILHNHRRLDWIVDISRLIRDFTINDDWKSLERSSVTHHTRIPVEIALKEAILWSGNTLPSKFSDFSTWPSPSEWEERMWKYAAIQETSFLAVFHLRLKRLPGFVEKLKYCGRFILPPSHLMIEYRRSESSWDPYLAHIRRWWSFIDYL